MPQNELENSEDHPLSDNHPPTDELLQLLQRLFPSNSQAFEAGDAAKQFGLVGRDVNIYETALAFGSPQVEDLFEIVQHPGDVPSAIFRNSFEHGLHPSKAPYIPAREGSEDVQQDIYRALRRSGGGLLIRGRSGLGKTLEATRIAVQLCSENWVICIANSKCDSLLGKPSDFPDKLRDNRVLFIFDDLHQRVGMGGQEPFGNRLNEFVAFFKSRKGPGELYVIATARIGHQYDRLLGFSPDKPLWECLKVFDLPEFGDDALTTLLINTAKWAEVDIGNTSAETLISNCDRTPGTILKNILRARQLRQSLGSIWLPTQGRTWEESFDDACGRWPTTENIFEALHLIREAGLPTRIEYVEQVASRISGSSASQVADELVAIGLLGIRDGLLDAYGDEQLQDYWQNTGKELPKLIDHWTVVIETGFQRNEDVNLLHTVAFRVSAALVSSERYDEAENLVSVSIDYFQDDVNVILYGWRGLIRTLQGKLNEAVSDITNQIESIEVHPPLFLLRANLYQGLERYIDAENDQSEAILRGEDSDVAFFSRGITRFHLGKNTEAEIDFTEAIKRGMDNVEVYHMRGLSRFHLGKYDEAEQDFTAEIDRDSERATAYQQRAGVRVYNEDRLPLARQDCEKAQELDPDNNFTIGRWGDLHLALREYPDAISYYKAALEADSGKGWGLKLGLAYLLAGQLNAALLQFESNIPIARVSQIRGVLRNLAYWTDKHSDSIESLQAQETVNTIRQMLQERLDQDKVSR